MLRLSSKSRESRARTLLASMLPSPSDEPEPAEQAPAPRLSLLEGLDEMEGKLVAAGFPAMSEWWRATVLRFYRTGRRQLVDRVGRRGGKSSTLCRVAVCEAIYGDYRIPPGDIGVVAIVSVKRSEAAERLRTIKAILDALGVKYGPIEDGIILAHRPVAFRVFSATIAGVSGFTCICAICDEVAKWRDADTGANPAREVLASLRPTMATQPSARIFLSSSPFGSLDAHAAAFLEGETEHQCVAYAPSWVANPTLTEEQTRREEPDERVWQREYKALPQEEVEHAILSPTHLDRAEREGQGELPREYGVHYVAHIDPATRGNAWTLVVACKRLLGGRVVRAIALAREWRGTPSKPLDAGDVLEEIAGLLGPYGLDTVSSDSWSGDALAALARRIQVRVSETETRPMRLLVEPLTSAAKLQRWQDVLTWFSDDAVDLPKHAQLRADLLATRKRLTPNGYTMQFAETPDGRHADYAPAAAGALAKAIREPVIRDDRPQVVQEQEAHFRAVHKKYRKKPEVPWWKRTG